MTANRAARSERRDGHASLGGAPSFAAAIIGASRVPVPMTSPLAEPDVRNAAETITVPDATATVPNGNAQPEQPEQRSQTRLWQRLGAALLRGRTAITLWLMSAVAALLLPQLLLHNDSMHGTVELFYSLGFDKERVVLLEELVVTLLVGLLVSIPLRRRIPAILGSVSSFAIWYLAPFVAQAQHPGLGPQGIPRVLIPGALGQVTLLLLAVAVLSAAIGAAIGAAYGGLLVTPVLGFGARLLLAVRQPSRANRWAAARAFGRMSASLALAGLLVAALVIGSAAPNTILSFGLESTLYRLAPGATGREVPHGSVQHVQFVSPALGGMTRDFEIYLPPTYDAARGERYPTLYLLHGSPGRPHDWMSAGQAPALEDALLAEAKMRETIIVSANGNGALFISEWANSFDGRQRMEDALVHDLVGYVDAHYRTLADPADRSIGGNSEGGFGAVNLALHHPNIFGAALSVGGYFAARGAVFGYGPGSDAYRAYNSPSAYVLTPAGKKAAHAVNLIIGVGTLDRDLYTDGMAFYKTLTALGMHTQLIKNTGGHSWALWALQLGQALVVIEPPRAVSATPAAPYVGGSATPVATTPASPPLK